MPSLEITQAGINGIASFDPFGNSPTSNFNYCNVYNVDPTTFNKTTFKTFTTAAQQIAYLASTTTGARNGYATPPNFPYQANANALNRVGNSGTVVANQPALRMNKVNTSQVNYLHQLATGYGDYYFNLLVIYNTFNTSEANRSADKNMPIAFIYLFDGMQFKSQSSAIEINTVLAYTGIASTVEILVNPTTTAQFLEISSADLLPTPTASPSNVYLIRNPTPVWNTSTNNFGSTIATLDTVDLDGSTDNLKLWSFKGYDLWYDVVVAANGSNSVTRTSLDSYAWYSANINAGGYIMQVLSGAYVGQCRRLTVASNFSNIQWATPFGGTIPASVKLRIYVPNGPVLRNPEPSADDVNYHSSVRANVQGSTPDIYVYDGWGGNALKSFPNVDLNYLPVAPNYPNANWLVTSSYSNLPSGFSGDGVLTMIRDTGSYARQTIKELNGSGIRVWERNLNISNLTATAWTDITAVPVIPVIPMPTLTHINSDTCVHTDTIGFITMTGYTANVPSGTTTAYTFAGLGLPNFPNRCYNLIITTGNLNSKNDNINLISKGPAGFSVDNTNSGSEMNMWIHVTGN